MNKGIQLGSGVESSNSKGSNRFNSFLKNAKKYIAFTLAETLIVMGIIGIVAALTVPNVNSSTNDMEKVTKVKKLYAELSQAHDRATAVYGPVETWFTNLPSGTNSSQRYLERISEFLKLQKICTTNGSSNCGAKFTASPYSSSSLSVAAVLNSGAIIGINFNSATSCAYVASVYTKTRDVCGSIYVDIDGKTKGKNRISIDQFAFNVTRNGIKPVGDYEYVDAYLTNGIVCKYTFKDSYGTSPQGITTTGWVIENGNMDYLKADDQGRCKNNPSRILGYGDGLVKSCK